MGCDWRYLAERHRVPAVALHAEGKGLEAEEEVE
jgi:hypothetical protein